jgi:hypothetical protein
MDPAYLRQVDEQAEAEQERHCSAITLDAWDDVA